MPCKSKTAGHIAKRREIWQSEVLVVLIVFTLSSWCGGKDHFGVKMAFNTTTLVYLLYVYGYLSPLRVQGPFRVIQ